MVQLDLEKIKQRLEQMKDPRSRYPGYRPNDMSSNIWKPKKDGSVSTVRLVMSPHIKGDGDPFIMRFFHYGLGKTAKETVLCPSNNGDPCPVCDLSRSLYSTKNDADKATAKQLSAKQRFYAVVVDREDTTLTPKYWGFGLEVYNFLLEKLVSRQTCHYLNPEKGIDLEVSVDTNPKNLFPKTKVDFVRSDSALGSKEEIAKVLNSIKPFEDVFKETPLIEIKKKLSDLVNRGAEPKTDEQLNSSREVSRGSAVDDSLEEELKNAGVGTIEDQFEEALKAKRV